LGYLSAIAVDITIATISQLICYPLDTVRRRMMMTAGESDKRDSPYQCAIRIANNEGLQYLYAGSFANIVQTVAAASFHRNLIIDLAIDVISG